MASIIESRKPNENILNCSTITCLLDVLAKIVIENVLLALQWEAILVRAVLDPNNKETGVLTATRAETFAQLKRPEVIINEQPWERIDVGNADDVKTTQQAGKKCGKGTKKSSRSRKRERKEQAEREAKRKQEEQERLRKWEDRWEKELQVQEERDNAECCAARGMCLKPRTRSNVWINVKRDRSIQEIHMTFKHVPVPRPKPPPLPPLKGQKAPEEISTVKKSDKNVMETGTVKKSDKNVTETSTVKKSDKKVGSMCKKRIQRIH